jgi:hypothetical protein
MNPKLFKQSHKGCSLYSAEGAKVVFLAKFAERGRAPGLRDSQKRCTLRNSPKGGLQGAQFSTQALMGQWIFSFCIS